MINVMFIIFYLINKQEVEEKITYTSCLLKKLHAAKGYIPRPLICAHIYAHVSVVSVS